MDQYSLKLEKQNHDRKIEIKVDQVIKRLSMKKSLQFEYSLNKVICSLHLKIYTTFTRNL